MHEIDGKAKKIKAWLLDEIKNGSFDRSRPLPGDFELMERFGVSRGTVRAALVELQHLGLIVRRRGVGTVLSKRGERRSGVIGLLFPEIDACEYFKDVEYELMRYGKRLGYTIEVVKCVVEDAKDVAAEIRRAARAIAARHVEGVVFRPIISEKYTTTNQEVVKIFEHAETPVVLFDSDVVRKPHRSACDIVAVNNVDSGRRVAEYLIESGRKKIAFLTVDCVAGGNENMNNRFFGVSGESVVRGLRDGVRPVGINPSDEAALRRLFRSKWRPDAFVCTNDEVAVRLVQALQAIKLRVPEDVAIVGFDDVACARQSVPPLTTVRQPSRQIAQALLKTLVFRMRSPDAPPQEIYLESPLVCRGTT